MITGYNTDVRHADLVIHVQTEDKGQGNPLIESLIYVGGQVLAARRSSYSQVLEEGKGEEEIVRRMERQHRTMIAAIKSGRFDSKLLALLGDRAPEALTASVAAAAMPASESVTTHEVGDNTMTAAAVADGDATGVAVAAPPAIAAAAAAAASPASPASAEPTLDQVILEYLTNEASQEQLLLTVDEEGQITLGLPASLTLRTSSSKTGDPIAGADVTVRMISTVDEPQALAQGRTDDAGHLQLDFEVPALERGTAALIITASSPIGRAEIKQLL